MGNIKVAMTEDSAIFHHGRSQKAPPEPGHMVLSSTLTQLYELHILCLCAKHLAVLLLLIFLPLQATEVNKLLASCPFLLRASGGNALLRM